MKLTPLDVRHQEFPSRMGGYDRPSVRAFLNDLSDHFEALLTAQQDLREEIAALNRQLDERRAAEDEIRRAVVSAERISTELRQNAERESALMLKDAHTQRDALIRDAEARAQTVDAQHRARLAELDTDYRERQAALERAYHDLAVERDRAQAERLAVLEREFSDRHADLSARLSAARQEYAQFVGSYHALMTNFSELSARHLLPPGGALTAARLPDQPLPALDRPALPDPAPATPPALATSDLSANLRALWGMPAPQTALVGNGAGAQTDDEPAPEPARVEGQQFL